MKKILLLISALSVTCLSSCNGSEVNKFKDGTFFSTDSDSILEIHSITKEEFDVANSINVVKDHSKEKDSDYYLIELFSRIDDKWTNLEMTNINYSKINKNNNNQTVYSFDKGSFSFDAFYNFYFSYEGIDYILDPRVSNYTLTFKLAEDGVDELYETNATSNYKYEFEYPYNYQLTEGDLASITNIITKDLPKPGGGYWDIGGYYSSLNKEEFILPNNTVDYNYTIYYTWVGGPVAPPEDIIPEGYTKGLEYELSDDGTYYKVTGTGYSGQSVHDILIPPLVNGLPVTTIGEGIDVFGTYFSGFATMYPINIILPDSITAIEKYGFASSTGLKNISLSNNIKNIGKAAFYNCSELKSITMPSELEKIENYAFMGCSALESITFDNKLTEVGNWMFYDCINLLSINYLGTVAEWNNLVTYGFKDWSAGSSITEIICQDGIITL